MDLKEPSKDELTCRPVAITLLTSPDEGDR